MGKDITSNKLTVHEAAALMDVSPQFVRIGLQQGVFPWGYALKLTGKKFAYFISRQKFEEATGIRAGS
jgi:hypothetical protein